MIAVVVEENNLAADLALQPSGGLKLGKQKPLRKKPARLLAKADNGCVAHVFSARAVLAGRITCNARLNTHARGAADEVIPEIRNIERRKAVAQEIEREDERLCRDRRPEHRRAADVFQKKRHQENSQHHAVKNRANDIDGFDEIFRKTSEQRESDGDNSPERREPFAARTLRASSCAASGRKCRQRSMVVVVPSALSSPAFDPRAAGDHHGDEQANDAMR